MKGKGVPKPKPAKPDEGEKALKTPLNIFRQPLATERMERVKTTSIIRSKDEAAVAVCSVEGCSRPKHAKGFCQLHYDRWRRARA